MHHIQAKLYKLTNHSHIRPHLDAHVGWFVKANGNPLNRLFPLLITKL